MARIIAAQRIVNMARGRLGRNRLRAQEASLAFDSFKEKDASAADALAHSKGWVFIPSSVISYPDGVRPSILAQCQKM